MGDPPADLPISLPLQPNTIARLTAPSQLLRVPNRVNALAPQAQPP
jgi:hypothetical protein